MNKRFNLIFLLIVIIGFAYSCKEKIFTSDVNCDECYEIKPDSADIIVHVTLNDENPVVPLVVYRGPVDDNNIEYTDTAYGTTYYLYVPVDAEYSVKAKYKSGDKTIYAIDGDKIKLKHVSDACSSDCWVIVGGEFFNELKY